MSTINHIHQNKRRFFTYLRVATPKQGERVSLLTQREAIARFAAERGFLIVGWFEEKETAAKRGRPVFGEVLKKLGSGEARVLGHFPWRCVPFPILGGPIGAARGA